MNSHCTARWGLAPVLAVFVILVDAPVGSADEKLRVDDMVVVLIDSVEVAATETGLIAQLGVREGEPVDRGEVVGKLDDRKVRLNEKVAEVQWEIAAAKANDGLAAELAEKKLAHQRQLARQHEIVRDIAARKAENEVRVLASQKAEGVAKNELDRATRARREYVDSVSQSEIDGLRLAYERSQLETRQADFQRQIDELNFRSESEAAKAHVLNIDQSKIQLAQAIADRRVSQLQQQLQQQQLQLATLAVQQHQIISPLSGMVVEKMRRQGDWVKPGDPILRVVRLDTLRAEGFVDAAMIDTLRCGLDVTVTAAVGEKEVVTRPGKIVFTSPEIDPVNNEVRFWVEFDNPQLRILPGMRVSVSVP